MSDEKALNHRHGVHRGNIRASHHRAGASHLRYSLEQVPTNGLEKCGILHARCEFSRGDGHDPRFVTTIHDRCKRFNVETSAAPVSQCDVGMVPARQGFFAIYALLAAGCAATLNVSSHVDRGADFSIYRTYEWGPADALPTGDRRLDRDTFFVDAFQGAVEKQLRDRGLQVAEPGSGDLLIHFHATIRHRLDSNAIDRAHGYCAVVECAPPRSYEAGTLVLDLVDARSNTLIWRGWVQTDLEGVLGNRTRLAEVIEHGVERMFARYPHTRELAETTQRP